MATFALVTLPLSGHIHPMMAAARALVRVGHRAVVLGPVDLVRRLPDDVEAQPIGERDLPAGALDAQCACLSRMQGAGDLLAMFRAVARLSEFYVTHLPAGLERLGASAVLHDQLEPGAGLVARGLSRSLGLRHLSLACALPMNREPSVPPPFMGWRHREGAFWAWMNGGYYTVVDALLREQGRVLEAAAQRFGVCKPARGPDGAPLQDWQRAWSVDDGLSRTHDMAQGLASLDYPRTRPPAYLGPLRDGASRYPGLASIAAERDGRPLCFVSLGTLMGARADLLGAMARAATRRGLQPVVVHGGRLADPGALPAGTIARPFLDQAAVMAECEAAIIHGGYNSTTDAAAAGLPLVVVPVAFEQAAIGARVERAQLGRRVGRRGPDLAQRIALSLGDTIHNAEDRAARRRARFEALAAPGTDGLVAMAQAALDGVPAPDPAAAPRASELAPGLVPLPAE